MLCLFVRAGAERLAVPAANVVEVVPAVPLHPPLAGPPWLAGVFPFRGAVVPVVDLHRLTAGEPCPHRLSARIVVLEAGGRRLGLLAERVTDLRPLAEVGVTYPSATAPGRPDLGPQAADADGLYRLPDVARLVPLAYPDAGGPP